MVSTFISENFQGGFGLGSDVSGVDRNSCSSEGSTDQGFTKSDSCEAVSGFLPEGGSEVLASISIFCISFVLLFV